MPLQGGNDLLEGEFDEQVRPPGFRQQGGGDRLQRALGGQLADLGRLADRCPVPQQQDREPVVAAGFEREAAFSAGQSLAVAAQAVEQLAQGGRRTVAMPAVDHHLVHLAEIQLQPGFRVRVRDQFLEGFQEVDFQADNLLQQLVRTVLDPMADIGAEQGELFQDALAGHVVQGADNPLGLGLGLQVALHGRKGGQAGQFVGAERTVLAVPHHQFPEDGQPALLLSGGKTQRGDAFRCLLKAADRRLALEDAGPVLVALQVTGPFQPGQRRAHPGVAVVQVGLHLDHIEAEQVAGGQHHGVFAAGHVADAAQKAGDLVPAEHRTAAQAKLLFDVLIVEDEDAFGGLAVPAGPAGLLQVVFQRARDIGVDDQAHILLVDAHAEGVGRADDRGGAADETVLDALLQRGLQAGVEGFGRVPVLLQEFGQFLGVLAGRAVDNNAALVVVAGPQHVVNRLVLTVPVRGQDFVVQVGALDTAGKMEEPETKLALDDVGDLRGHILLGRGGEALHGRDGDLLPFGEFTDEADGVEVIGTEVMPPFGQAVRLVEHPGADLPLADGLPEGGVAQLFRGDEQDADIAQADAFEHLAAFRQGEHAVQRGRDPGAGEPGKIVDLVLHQGLQRRDDHGQQVAPLVAHQRRQQVAERFAAAGRQGGEQGAAAGGGMDDRLLQAVPVRRGRFGPEGREAVVVLEEFLRVVVGPAEGAVFPAAVVFPQLVEEDGHLRKLVAHPRGQHRVAAGHRQPGGDIGQRRGRQGAVRKLQHQLLDRGPAGALAGKPGKGLQQILAGEQRNAHGGQGLGGAGQVRVRGEKAAIEQGDVRTRRELPHKGVPLLGEYPAGQATILDRIVYAVAHQLVVLDQPVVGIGGVGEGGEKQGVDLRLAQEPQVRGHLAQPGQVVVEDVVAEDETGLRCKSIEFGQGVAVDLLPGRDLEDLLTQDRTQGIDDILFVDLDIEQQAMAEQIFAGGRHLGSETFGSLGPE